MLQERKDQGSEQKEDSLESLKDKFAQEREKVIDTEVSKEDRLVKLVVSMDQICGCGGKDDVNVIRTVPWDSELKDGDKVDGFDDSDEVQDYV